jgi:single-strand DNA-binding protein
VNRVTLLGNLTRDVELRTAGSTAVGGFGIAINRKWKDAQGQAKEEVTFVDCEAWGKTAENIAKYFAKGRQILVEGRLKLDQWEKDGQKHSKLKVVVDTFHFTGNKADAPAAKSGSYQAAKAAMSDDDLDPPF